MEEASPLWLEECLLLAMAWTAIWMWRTVNPPRALLVIAFTPAAVATALAAMSLVTQPTERDNMVTMFACVAALLVPASLMMRHQVVRLIKFVFPRARLVRRRR